jgi:anaerobic selenocysteine-containing dehydrogenase
VLPATTQLEHWDIHGSYGHTDVLLNRPDRAPRSGAQQRADLSRSGHAYGQAGLRFCAACFAESDETLCRTAVSDTAIDFEELLQQGFAHIPLPDAPFAEGGFATPSGKCEFDNPALARLGINTLPDYLPNYEPPDGLPAGHDLAARTQLSQQQLCQCGQSSPHGRAPAAGDAPR